MSARDEILERIATAHRAAPPAAPDYDDIPRVRRTEDQDRSTEALIELLTDRLVDYRARVRTATVESLAGMISEALTEQGVSSLVAPAGLPGGWLSESAVDVLRDEPEHPTSVMDLDRVDGVITGCAVAIAETGTLILDASPDQGRRAITLIPDYHLCVVSQDAVMPDVPSALARVEPTRPLTMISGPSATSDIELNRVEGVHGPRTLEVIVVTAPGLEA
jgi:L-lactate dehydrogenase complex protein LldG